MENISSQIVLQSSTQKLKKNMPPFTDYTLTRTKEVRRLARLSFVALLVITLMAVSALTACGSDNDAAPPTATPILTPTVSPSVPSSGSEELRIMSQDSKLFELDLNAGDTLIISYSGFAPQGANAKTALFVPVDFRILDPANEPLLEAGGLVRNFVDVQVETSGIHRLVFTNPVRLQGRIVSVDYYIVPSTADPSGYGNPCSHRHPRRQHRLRLCDASHSGYRPLRP